MEIAAAATAWLGASIVVLADGRRGLAAGLGLATLGLAILALIVAGPLAAGALLLGGVAAAARRAVAGPSGWAIMPAGSTPRLVMCVAGGLLALWVGLSVTSGGGGALRFVVLAVLGLAGARSLWSEDPSVILTAVAVLVLGIAVGASLSPSSPGVWPFALAAVLAAATSWIPFKVSRAASSG